MRSFRLLFLFLLGSLALAACGAPAASHRQALGATSEGARPALFSRSVPRFGHIFLVVMENEAYSSALSDPSIGRLAHRYAYEANSYAASHPSLPNYLALTGGSTFGISSDCLGCFVRAPDLGAELSAAGVSWEGYFQGVSRPCYLGTSYGVYAAKHNPFRYYRQVRSSPRLCRRLRPAFELPAVLSRPASRVPRFVWVTPDVCNDGHSCSLLTAGRWLAGFVRRVTASAAWKANGLLVVTWDEGSFGDDSSITPSGRVLASGGGGHILTLVITPRLGHGTVLRQPLSHYGLLATIEEDFHLPLLGKARGWAHHTLFKFSG